MAPLVLRGGLVEDIPGAFTPMPGDERPLLHLNEVSNGPGVEPLHESEDELHGIVYVGEVCHR